MIDLYKRLRTPTDATSGEIAEACHTCENKRIHDAAGHILLQEERRILYDQMHRQLLRIGRLRANLGLSHIPEWQAEFGDFDQPPTLQGSLMDRMERRYGSRHSQFLRKNWKYLAALLYISAFSVIVGFLAARFSPSQNHPQTFSQPALTLPTTGLLTKAVPEGSCRLILAGEAFGPNACLRLLPTKQQMPVAMAFVRAGETLSLQLPVGEYELRIASGTEWYGLQHLFGPTTIVRSLTLNLDTGEARELRLFSPNLPIRSLPLDRFEQ